MLPNNNLCSSTRVIKSFDVTKGSNFSLSVHRLEADLTADLLTRLVCVFCCTLSTTYVPIV